MYPLHPTLSTHPLRAAGTWVHTRRPATGTGQCTVLDRQEFMGRRVGRVWLLPFRAQHPSAPSRRVLVRILLALQLCSYARTNSAPVMAKAAAKC
jgi:hypothetical protein